MSQSSEFEPSDEYQQQLRTTQLWIFIALESQSKFWVNFELGSRTNWTANRLVKRLKELAKWDRRLLLRVTTDKLAAYKNALSKQFKSINYVYLRSS